MMENCAVGWSFALVERGSCDALLQAPTLFHPRVMLGWFAQNKGREAHCHCRHYCHSPIHSLRHRTRHRQTLFCHSNNHHGPVICTCGVENAVDICHDAQVRLHKCSRDCHKGASLLERFETVLVPMPWRAVVLHAALCPRCLVPVHVCKLCVCVCVWLTHTSFVLLHKQSLPPATPLNFKLT